MEEKAIIKEYEQASAYIGKKLYQFCLPLLEIHGALNKMWQLNQDLYAIKNPPKKEEKPSGEVA